MKERTKAKKGASQQPETKRRRIPDSTPKQTGQKNTCPSTEDRVKKWYEVRDTPTRYYSRGSRLLFANAVLEQELQ